MATTTPERRVLRIPSQTELEAALATPFQDFPSPAIVIASAVEFLATREDMGEEELARFEWPDRAATFEDIGRLYVWLRHVRDYIAETELALAKIEEHLDALETFTPEHGPEAFRARIAQAERRAEGGD